MLGSSALFSPENRQIASHPQGIPSLAHTQVESFYSTFSLPAISPCLTAHSKSKQHVSQVQRLHILTHPRRQMLSNHPLSTHISQWTEHLQHSLLHSVQSTLNSHAALSQPDLFAKYVCEVYLQIGYGLRLLTCLRSSFAKPTLQSQIINKSCANIADLFARHVCKAYSQIGDEARLLK